MKTIREWLNELPEDVRDKAIANTEENVLAIKFYTNLADALNGAFIWEESQQGFDYWNEIHDTL
jgi:hypothetical protein